MGQPRLTIMNPESLPQAPSRRHFVATLATASLSWGLGTQALAQIQGTRKIICPFAGGGISDKLSRVVAHEAARLSGENWYVQNTPGAGGLVGMGEALRSEPNGQTILLGAAGVFRTQGRKDPSGFRIDPINDLEPIIILGAMPLVCVMRPSNDRPSLRTYLDQLRASKAPFVYATPGHGSTSHFMGAFIAQHHHLESIHVPFGGSAPSVAAVLGGHVACAIVDPMLVYGQIQSGDLHCLAISSLTRDPRLAQVPSIVEEGTSPYEFTSWQGFFVQSTVPKHTQAALGQLFQQLARSTTIQSFLH